MRRLTARSGRLAATAALAFTLLGGSALAAQAPPSPSAPSLQASIKNVVIIYQENWSFDGLYGNFPGANGLSNAAPTIPQVDKVSGTPFRTLPQPLIASGIPDPSLPAGLPVAPYDLSKYVKPSALTGDIVHRYYQERSQIDGGKMDKFMTWSDNPGLVLSYFDATSMPEGKLAAQFTLADNFFHSAFGGSFLNHQWLICACTPVFPNAPPALIAVLDPSGSALALDAAGKIVHDGAVTPDGFAVNTLFTVNKPHPANAAPATLVPQQNAPTIGDRLSAANVSWKWYSGGWNNALAGNPDPLFQFHHQPFAYFQAYADGTPAKAAHLADEANFFTDLQAGTLPAVSFIKPLGPDNEHPGYAAELQGQAHVASIVTAIAKSPYWNSTAIIVTYDENGGRWDHVPPPAPLDRWGPGSRVPTIVISPWAKRNFIDHTQYETASVLAFIEKLYNLQPLNARDGRADPLTNAFDFRQTPQPFIEPN
ncbi:MAG: acid phosphatase [Candidatus Velthaea sp.]